MKKLFYVTLFALIPVFLFAQENANHQLNFKQKTFSTLHKPTQTFKVLFPSRPLAGTITTSTKRGQLWNPGYYSLWFYADTTSAGNSVGDADSLWVTVYSLNYDGSFSDQDSTTVTTATTGFDWTAETWHGPFGFTLHPSFGIGIKVRTTANDTSDLSMVVIY